MTQPTLYDTASRRPDADALALAANLVHEGIAVFSPAGPVAYANDAFARMLGAAPGTLAPDLTWHRLHVPEEHARLAAEALPVLLAGGTWQGEAEARRLDGTAFPASVSLGRLPDGTLVLRLRDRSDARRRAAAAREQEARYRLLLEAVQDYAIYLLDTEGCIRHWTPGASRLTGYTADEVEGRHVALFRELGDAERADADAGLAAALGEGRHAEEGWRLRKDGSRFWANVLLTPVRDAQGRHLGFAKVVRDRTAQHEAAEALRASETRYRLAARASNDVLYDWDLAADVVHLSDAMAAITGYALHRLERAGTWWRAHVHPDDQATYDHGEAALHGTSDGWASEYRFRHADGHWLQLSDSAFIERNAAGRPTRVVGTLRDITEQRRLELQVRQAQKMEALGTLAGGIAHDFNNILAGIMGHAELALDSEPSPGPVREGLHEVLAAARRARDLVRQILSFSRARDRSLAPVDPGAAVREVAALLRATTPAAISIRTHVSPDAGRVLGDASQIHQVILNLATNAVQAMRDCPTGTLELRASRLHAADAAGLPGTLGAGDTCVLTVRDTGTGIPADVLPRIFDPFFTTKEVGRGSGLGLSVVHGIVTAHGGTVDVQSEPGSGTTVRVFLPALVEGVASDVPAAPAPAPAGGGRLLVVDDEPMVLRVMAQRLRRLGYDPVPEDSAREALARFTEAPDAFVGAITDQSMPQMTGASLAVELLKRRPGFPIVLCTGYSEAIDAERAAALGIAAFLQKPVETAELAATLARILPAPAARAES